MDYSSKILTVGFWLILLLAVMPTVGRGQTPLSGQIFDRSGEAIAGARITVTDERNHPIEAISDGDGRFTIMVGGTGTLRLEVVARGFSKRVEMVRRDLAGGATPLRIELEPGLLADAITVTPARTEIRLVDAPSSVSALTRVEVVNSAAQTMDDLLRQVPGFSIFRRTSSLVANPTTQGVSLRGAGATGASRTLVLQDGIPLNDAFGGWVYWDRVPRQAVEQIEVVRGGGSDLYGSDALSGVINVISRKPVAPAIDIEGSLGNRRTRDLNFFAGRQWRRLQATISGEIFRTDGYYLIAPDRRGAADDLAGSKHRAISTRLSYQQSDNASLWIRGALFDEDRRNGTRQQYNDTATESLAIGGRTRTSDGSEWNLSIFANQQRFHQSFTAVAAGRATEALTRLQFVPSRDAGFSFNWSRVSFTRHTLVAGADLRGVRGTSDETIYTAGRPTRFDSAGGRQRRAGFFAQDIISISTKWQLAASARIDQWRDSSAGAVQRALSTGVMTPRFFAPRNASAFSPRLSLLYRPTEGLTLRAATYRAFRAPTLNELYREFRVGDTLTRANEKLTAERLTGGEVGAAWNLAGRTHLRLTCYWTETRDPIINFTESITSALITRQRRNLGRTRSSGLEAESEFRLTGNWRLTAGYLFADATVRLAPQDPTLVGLLIPQVPRHQFTLQTSYSNPRYLTAAFQFRASGAQFDDDRNQFSLARFAVFDVNASRRLGKFIEIFVAVQNLFDQRYAVARTPIETLGMPRMVRGGLRFNLAQ
jgi:outer membrane receptor protein involved in Fe transport